MILQLLHFRKPEVSISNGKVIVHPINEREPVPLSLHHIPLCISFAILQNDEVRSYFAERETASLSADILPSTADSPIQENLPESGSYLVLDPSDREELVINGMSFAIFSVKKVVLLRPPMNIGERC